MPEWADSVVPKLTPRAKRLLRLVALGHTQGEAAGMCGYSLNRACILCNSQLGQDYIAMLEADVNQTLVQENAKVELDTKAEAMKLIKADIISNVEVLQSLRDDSPKDEVRLNAAKHLLSVGGIVAKESVEVQGSILADPGTLEAIQRLTQLVKPAPVGADPSPAGA